MALIKTYQLTDLLPLTALAANLQLKGTVFDASLLYAARFYIDFSPTDTTAPANGGCEIRIEGSGRVATNDIWRPLAAVITNLTTSVTEAAPAGVVPGTITFAQNPTAQYGNNGLIFFKNGTFANSEWARVTAVAALTSITILDGVTNDQSASTICTQAEEYMVELDLSTIKLIRVVVNNNRGTNRPVAVRVAFTTLDSI
jgi:hypothetical protein